MPAGSARPGAKFLVHAAAAVEQQHDLGALPDALDVVLGRCGPASVNSSAASASVVAPRSAQPTRVEARSRGA